MTKQYEKPALQKLNKYDVNAVKRGQVELGGVIRLRQGERGNEEWWEVKDHNGYNLLDRCRLNGFSVELRDGGWVIGPQQ